MGEDDVKKYPTTRQSINGLFNESLQQGEKCSTLKWLRGDRDGNKTVGRIPGDITTCKLPQPSNAAFSKVLHPRGCSMKYLRYVGLRHPSRPQAAANCVESTCSAAAGREARMWQPTKCIQSGWSCAMTTKCRSPKLRKTGHPQTPISIREICGTYA